jgi:hypothetical protein
MVGGERLDGRRRLSDATESAILLQVKLFKISDLYW